MTDEHPNAALTRRVFEAFGRDVKVIAAALDRDVVWRVPGNTVMSGEYRGLLAVVGFLQRTGLETDGTYGSALRSVLANDEWAVAIYRAYGRRNGMELDIASLDLGEHIVEPIDEPTDCVVALFDRAHRVVFFVTDLPGNGGESGDGSEMTRCSP